MTGDDVSVSLLIALMVLVILICVRYRLRAADVGGYWGTFDGAQYFIRARGTDVEVSSPKMSAYGHISPLSRGICVGALCGTVDFGARWIMWDNGDAWMKYGVGHRPVAYY